MLVHGHRPAQAVSVDPGQGVDLFALVALLLTTSSFSVGTLNLKLSCSNRNEAVRLVEMLGVQDPEIQVVEDQRLPAKGTFTPRVLLDRGGRLVARACCREDAVQIATIAKQMATSGRIALGQAQEDVLPQRVETIGRVNLRMKLRAVAKISVNALAHFVGLDVARDHRLRDIKKFVLCDADSAAENAWVELHPDVTPHLHAGPTGHTLRFHRDPLAPTCFELLLFGHLGYRVKFGIPLWLPASPVEAVVPIDPSQVDLPRRVR